MQRVRHGRRLAFDLRHGCSSQAVGRQRTGRVAAVHAGLLDVFHHAANPGGAGRVADAVHVALDGVVQKAVQQHGRIMADLDGFAHIALQVALLVHDFHGTATEHIAGAHH